MAKGERRDPLEIKLEEKAALERRMKALADDLNPLDQEIAIELEKRTKQDNEYLGAGARILLETDKTLKRRLIEVSPAVIEAARHKVQAKKSLERLLGKLPKMEPDRPNADYVKNAEPDPLQDAAE